jgi:hypothetical protein
MFVLLTSGQQEQVRARQGNQRAKRVGVSGRQAREQWCEGVNKTAVVLIRSTGALREGIRPPRPDHPCTVPVRARAVNKPIWTHLEGGKKRSPACRRA